MKVNRMLVSRKALEARLMVELRKLKGCQAVQVGGITPLAKPDKSGCNWSETFVVLWSNPLAAAELKAHLPRVTREARARFNLA
jgi:hypothetical protein